ncbi:DUF4233 domain-containing protein [Kineococcus sp. R8]|uniref:DUF4233 domain-containing protein n=1 Tax=Kineococcus siccus TaxID=2696567 RepID=UPI001412E728|nr:DUF4233 domain-containing protein [Kineococcus siccus]
MRSPKRTLAATTLVAEALVVFFATLVASRLSSVGLTTSLVAGGVLLLLCLLCAGMLRRPAGYALGWVLQAVIVACGFWVPMMFGIGLVFAVIWWAAIHFGGKIEREQAEVARRLDG